MSQHDANVINSNKVCQSSDPMKMSNYAKIISQSCTTLVSLDWAMIAHNYLQLIVKLSFVNGKENFCNVSIRYKLLTGDTQSLLYIHGWSKEYQENDLVHKAVQ